MHAGADRRHPAVPRLRGCQGQEPPKPRPHTQELTGIIEMVPRPGSGVRETSDIDFEEAFAQVRGWGVDAGVGVVRGARASEGCFWRGIMGGG